MRPASADPPTTLNVALPLSVRRTLDAMLCVRHCVSTAAQLPRGAYSAWLAEVIRKMADTP